MERFELYNKARLLAGAEMRARILSPDWQMDGEDWHGDEVCDILEGVPVRHWEELGQMSDAIISKGDKAIELAVIIGTPGLD